MEDSEEGRRCVIHTNVNFRSAPLPPLTLLLVFFFLSVAPFSNSTGGPACTVRAGLFTGCGDGRAVYSASVHRRVWYPPRAAASASSSAHLEHVCRARLGLRGKLFLSFSVCSPLLLCVCVRACVCVCVCCRAVEV